MERLARAVALAVVVALGGGACASLDPGCTKIPITVATKEERSRIEMRAGPPRTTPRGTREETQEPVRVTEHWVRAVEGGTWYRVNEREFAAAAAGQRIEVCR